MSLDLRWEDENGKELAVLLYPPKSRFESLISGTSDSNLQCLRYIDPYGDTVFNHLQIPHLISDLNKILPHCVDSETQQHVEGMLQIVKAAQEVHTYIKFYGD